MTKISNLESFFISGCVAGISLIISFIYCQISKTEWTIISVFIVNVPIFLLSIPYINKREKEIKYLEELENLGK